MAGAFQELEVWQRAMALAVGVYRVSRRFPGEERYGLMAQVRRAAVSVPSCIAEGQGRMSRREFARFVSISMGSLAEVETQLLLAHRLGYIDDRPDELLDEVSEIARMLRGLRRSMSV